MGGQEAAHPRGLVAGWRQIKPVFGDCRSAHRHARGSLCVAQGHRGHGFAPRGAPLSENLERMWKVAAALVTASAMPIPVSASAITLPLAGIWTGLRARSCAGQARLAHGLLRACRSYRRRLGHAADPRRRSRLAGLAAGARRRGEKASSPSAARPASRRGLLMVRALWALHGHLEKLGIELHGDAYIFRNRSGAPYSVTRSATISATCAASNSVRSNGAPSADFRRTGAVRRSAAMRSPSTSARHGKHALGFQRAVRDLCPGERDDPAQRHGGAPPRAKGRMR